MEPVIVALSLGAAQVLRTVRRVVAVAVIAVATVGAVVVVLVVSDDDGDIPQRSPTPTTPTSAPPAFDVDRDGRPDFVQITGDVLPVPPEADDNASLGLWLPVAGTVLAAVIASGAALAVAMVNREGGRKLAELSDRHEALAARLDTIDGDEAV